MDIRPPSIILEPGQRGTLGCFSCTIQRHYDGNMYEVRMPGGPACVDVSRFLPTPIEQPGHTSPTTTPHP